MPKKRVRWAHLIKDRQNTNHELWRERKDDYYADSIFVTKGGGIGINCGGSVIVKPIREWFDAMLRWEDERIAKEFIAYISPKKIVGSLVDQNKRRKVSGGKRRTRGR